MENSELNEKLDEKVIGYNGKEYTLYELRKTANLYTNKDPVEQRIQLQQKYELIYNCKEDTVPLDLLEKVYGLNETFVEVWRTAYNGSKNKYLASNLGRIKLNGVILEQKDDSHNGYLKINKSNYSYKLIAMAFFGDTNGKHVHHINNNGFDCRPDNLIILDRTQHSKVHGWWIGKPSDENLDPAEIKD